MRIKLLSILVCTLMVTIAFSAIGNKMNNIPFNNPPIADAGGPYIGEEGMEIIFDASASIDPDGDELAYRWDFDADEIWDTDWTHDPICIYSYGDDYNYLAFVEVTDGIDNAYASSPSFIVNVDPEVDAGPDQVVNLGETVVYNGFFDDLGFLDDHVFSWAFGGVCAAINGTNATVQCTGIEVGYGHEWKCNVTTNGERIFDLHFYMSISDMDDSFQNGQDGIPSGFPEPPKHDIEISPSGHGMNVTFNEPLPDDYQFTLYTSVKNINEVEIYWTTTTSGGKPTNNGVMSKPNSPIGPFEKIYNEPGFYNSFLSIFDDDGGSDTDTMTVKVNNPPNPPIITGQTSGKTGTEYEYTFNAIDPEDDDILEYVVDWGDGTGEETISGPFASGEEVTSSHSWTSQETFTIKAKAKDILGAESSWTEFEVTIQRNRAVYHPLLIWFLERFSLLERLLLFIRVI